MGRRQQKQEIERLREELLHLKKENAKLRAEMVDLKATQSLVKNSTDLAATVSPDPAKVIPGAQSDVELCQESSRNPWEWYNLHDDVGHEDAPSVRYEQQAEILTKRRVRRSGQGLPVPKSVVDARQPAD